MNQLTVETFLREIYGEGTGFISVAYDAHKKNEPKTAIKWRNESLKWPCDENAFEKFAEEIITYNNSGWSVYFCPHLTKDRSVRKKSTALPSYVAWLDKDKGDSESIEPEPTWCWATSPGRFQAVWLFDDTVEGEELELINRYLIAKNDGDKGTFNVARLLRMPGLINNSYTPPVRGEVLWDDGPTYNLEKFLGDIKQEQEEKIIEIPERPHSTMPDKLPEIQDILKAKGDQIPAKAWKLLKAEPSPSDSWSEPLFHLECLLIESGLSDEEVFVIAKESPWNKYARDNRPAEALWEEIQKVKDKTYQNKYTETNGTMSWLGLNTLMAYSERPEWLVDNIWMDKNVGWLAGAGKSYKSVVSLDLALSIASGNKFLDTFEVRKPGPVLMVLEEDPLWRVAHRIQAMAKHKGIATTSINHTDYGVDFVVHPAERIPLYASVGSGFLFADDKWLDKLEASIEEYKPVMLMFDPMFMMMAGIDEFKSGEITAVLNRLKHWRNIYDCSIAIVHHYRKSSGDSNEKLYGNQALYAWSENSLFFDKPRDGNIVKIDRDIKDAAMQDPLRLEIFDIDEEYSFNVREGNVGCGSQKALSVEDRIVQLFQNKPRDFEITRKELLEVMSGSSQRIVDLAISNLHNSNIIQKERGVGRGATVMLSLTDVGRAYAVSGALPSQSPTYTES